jgi:hypothetical protein
MGQGDRVGIPYPYRRHVLLFFPTRLLYKARETFIMTELANGVQGWW